MDNLHTLIVISLLAFGVGHAIFSARIRFWSFLLLTIILFPILIEVYSSEWYLIIISSFLIGVGFANRDTIQDMLYNITDVGSSIAGFFKTKSSNNQQNQTDQAQFGDEFHQRTQQAKQQEWKAEQARREQEAKAQREQEKQRKQKQKAQQQGQRKSQYQNQNQQSSSTSSGYSNNHSQTHSEKIDQNSSKSNTSTQPPPPVDTRNPMEILGLKSGFTQQELKQAYKRESARCHPDRWQNKPEHIRKAMEEEQKLVNWAYKYLMTN